MAEMGEGSVYADHIGSVPKPTKKTWLEKANLLPTVQAALRCVLAVVVASLAQAPPLLPILFALFTCEGVNIYSNFQVEVLPEKIMRIVDSVFSYATDASADVEVTVAYEESSGV
jgi:hypothetical protein